MADSLQSAIATNAGAEKQTAIDVSGLINQQAGLQSNLYVEAQNASDAAALISTTKDRATLDAQNAASKTAQLVGGDVSDTKTEVISGLANTMRDSYTQWQQDQAEYKRQSQASFFDDPFQWINSKLMGGEEQARTTLNNTAETYNAAESRLDGVLKETTEGAIAARALERPITEATISASAQLARFTYDKIATDAATTVLQSNIAAIKELQAGNTAAINERIKGFEVANQAAQLDMRTKEFNIIMQNKQDELTAQNLMKTAYVRGLVARGLPAPSEDDLGKIMLLYKNKVGANEIQPIIDSGLYSLYTSGGIHFGNTPGQALLNISTGPSNFNDNNENTRLMKFLVDVGSNLPAQYNKNKPAEIVQGVNDVVGSYTKSWSANAESDKSLYKDQGFKTTLTANPTLKTTPFYNQVLAPIVTAGGDNLTANEMNSLATKAVADGKLTIEEARDGITKYYQTVISNNNRLLVSTANIDKQTGYMARNGSGLFSGTIDYSKADQVTMAILKANSPNMQWEMDKGRWTMEPAGGQQ